MKQQHEATNYDTILVQCIVQYNSTCTECIVQYYRQKLYFVFPHLDFISNVPSLHQTNDVQQLSLTGTMKGIDFL